ncbi:hypothetical protein E2I00_005562 [Balaenoptera physalus]|uniref:Ferritin light chain n=1 Tax=Balaenoptera physalus TaxID=9770 RepID=A0A643C326_BALPH|nr:hypothetical protein E2I00_005562 [Balaenoptera physalus]
MTDDEATASLQLEVVRRPPAAAMSLDLQAAPSRSPILLWPDFLVPSGPQGWERRAPEKGSMSLLNVSRSIPGLELGGRDDGCWLAAAGDSLAEYLHIGRDPPYSQPDGRDPWLYLYSMYGLTLCPQPHTPLVTIVIIIMVIRSHGRSPHSKVLSAELPLRAGLAVRGTDGLPVDKAAAQKLIHFYLVMEAQLDCPGEAGFSGAEEKIPHMLGLKTSHASWELKGLPLLPGKSLLGGLFAAEPITHMGRGGTTAVGLWDVPLAPSERAEWDGDGDAMGKWDGDGDADGRAQFQFQHYQGIWILGDVSPSSFLVHLRLDGWPPYLPRGRGRDRVSGILGDAPSGLRAVQIESKVGLWEVTKAPDLEPEGSNHSSTTPILVLDIEMQLSVVKSCEPQPQIKCKQTRRWAESTETRSAQGTEEEVLKVRKTLEGALLAGPELELLYCLPTPTASSLALAVGQWVVCRVLWVAFSCIEQFGSWVESFLVNWVMRSGYGDLHACLLETVMLQDNQALVSDNDDGDGGGSVGYSKSGDDEEVNGVGVMLSLEKASPRLVEIHAQQHPSNPYHHPKGPHEPPRKLKNGLKPCSLKNHREPEANRLAQIGGPVNTLRPTLQLQLLLPLSRLCPASWTCQYLLFVVHFLLPTNHELPGFSELFHGLVNPYLQASYTTSLWASISAEMMWLWRLAEERLECAEHLLKGMQKPSQDEWGKILDAMETAIVTGKNLNQVLLDLHTLVLPNHFIGEEMKLIKKIGHHLTNLHRLAGIRLGWASISLKGHPQLKKG